MTGKIIRRILRVILALVIFVLLLVGYIDRTPIREQPFYNSTIPRIDSLRLDNGGASQLHAGWTKVNITPGHSMPMAGYIPRDHFDAVHDSLFARIIVIDNGKFRAAMINVDLLIFPPLLRDRIYEKFDSSTFLYLSATHTHNAVGGWDPSIGGRFITGSFSEEYVNDIADRISSAVKAIDTKEASLQYWETDASDLIENRVNVDSGKVDGKVRGIKLNRSDSTSATLFTFSAHATSIAKESFDLSADYPAKAITMLEQKSEFVMFMSGMVGSTRFKWTPYLDYQFIDSVAPRLVTQIDMARYDSTMSSPLIRSAHVPIDFGPSQLRIEKNWKVNDWVFRVVFNRLKGELTYLEFGSVVFIGTPCDFAGEIYVVDELEQYAARYGKHLIITSFNGDYDGYITYDGHYDKSSKEEINALNWVGPYYGKYFSDMIKKLVAK